MLSFDSKESSLCDRELTLPMQAPLARYMKDEDSQRSEDARKFPRIVKQVVTNVESESFEEQELVQGWNIIKGTG